MLIEKIQNHLKQFNQKIRIVFPEGDNPSIQEAAIKLQEQGIIEPILIFINSSSIDVHKLKDIKSLSLDNLKIDSYANKLYEIRKEKGLTMDQAKELAMKTNYLASLMVKMNEADGEVCGIDYPTKDTLLPALQIIKTAPGFKLVSSGFIMVKGHEQYIFGDCAINLDPTAEELAEIGKGLIHLGRDLVKMPEIRAALLSYSTAGSGKGPQVDKVAQAYELLKPMQNNQVKIYGEIQFDAAYNLDVMHKKAKGLDWKESANVFIFPTINAGNIGYKIAQRMGGYEAIGPVLIGLGAPVNDLSRGASVEEVIALAYITAAQFVAIKEGK